METEKVDKSALKEGFAVLIDKMRAIKDEIQYVEDNLTQIQQYLE